MTASGGIGSGALIRLLTLLSPSFPIGGFAYSHGLEQAIDAGDIANDAQLTAWLAAMLTEGGGRNDAILLRLSYRAVTGDPSGAGLAVIARLAQAIAPSAELALETLQQGDAFAIAASPWMPAALARQLRDLRPLAYPVAFGAVAGTQDFGEDTAVAGYLHAWSAGLVSAGVRLIPLGQTAGLTVQSRLEASILEVAAATCDASPVDLWSACPRADIASMQHETTHTRLFRT